MKKACAPRGCWTEDFSNGSSREAACYAIDFGDAGGHHLDPGFFTQRESRAETSCQLGLNFSF
jgi:hypothetical protein